MVCVGIFVCKTKKDLVKKKKRGDISWRKKGSGAKPRGAHICILVLLGGGLANVRAQPDGIDLCGPPEHLQTKGRRRNVSPCPRNRHGSGNDCLGAVVFSNVTDS